MKRILNILILLLVLSVCLVGCGTDPDSAGGSSSDEQKTQTTTTDSNDNTTSTSTDNQSTGDQAATSGQNAVPAEVQQVMDNITGTWELATPQPDGNSSIIRVKIDNVSGFTFTTGTQTPDGTGSFYSRVGSYQIEGDTITFYATTGGESNDGSSYNLRQDFGVFSYTLSENPELTQITLTPTNEKAALLTGEGAITLNRV